MIKYPHASHTGELQCMDIGSSGRSGWVKTERNLTLTNPGFHGEFSPPWNLLKQLHITSQAIYNCIDDHFPTKLIKKLTRNGCHLNLLFKNEEE